MDKVLRCDCGFEARAADENELVTSVQRHAWSAHAMALTREQVLVMELRSELEAQTTVPWSNETDGSGRSAQAPEEGGRP